MISIVYPGPIQAISKGRFNHSGKKKEDLISEKLTLVQTGNGSA